MKRFFHYVGFLLLACSSVFSASAAPKEAELSLRDITSGEYRAKYVYGVNPMLDGESYTQLDNDGKRIVRRSFKNGKELEVLFDVATARGEKRFESIDGYITPPDERRILLRTETKMIYRRSYTAVYYLYDVENKKYEPLSDGGPQQSPLFSPDGNVVAFAREGNLFLVKLLFGNSESQVTKDGRFNAVLNGIPDWVNEEEFATNRSFDFSADSKMLAWVRYDESAVPVYDMTLYKGLAPERSEFDEYPGKYSYKYPVAGAKNSEVKVMTFDIKSGVTRTLKLPLDEDGYVPRIQFTSDPDRLAVVTLNRRQNRMDLYMANPRSTECRLTIREENERYIDEKTYSSLRFFDDRLAFISDRSGYKHLYVYNLAGQQLRQVTSGNYDVTAFYGYDRQTDRYFYASHEESPLRTAVYSVDRNGKKRNLTPSPGTNSAVFSTSCRYFLHVHSALGQPPVTSLRSAADGKLLTTMIDNRELAEKLKPLTAPSEFFTLTTSEGIKLNAWMMKPKDFNPAKKYPVIMYQYAGPGSQEVKDAWNMGFFPGMQYESYMASRGYIFVIVDGRGTGGRGADFEKCTYLKLGSLESHDQVEAARYLSRLPYVDGERIAIWGWSFGGFNTLMAMSDGSGAFRAGVAVAAPSNWKYYDTVYTERYMRTPKENAAGYADNPITRAAALKGDLLLVHGTADDNVHFRNFTEVSEAYVQAEKPFRQQVYTNRNHFINGGATYYHLFRTITDFFDEKLKP